MQYARNAQQIMLSMPKLPNRPIRVALRSLLRRNVHTRMCKSRVRVSVVNANGIALLTMMSLSSMRIDTYKHTKERGICVRKIATHSISVCNCLNLFMYMRVISIVLLLLTRFWVNARCKLNKTRRKDDRHDRTGRSLNFY